METGGLHYVAGIGERPPCGGSPAVVTESADYAMCTGCIAWLVVNHDHATSKEQEKYLRRRGMRAEFNSAVINLRAAATAGPVPEPAAAPQSKAEAVAAGKAAQLASPAPAPIAVAVAEPEAGPVELADDGGPAFTEQENRLVELYGQGVEFYDETTGQGFLRATPEFRARVEAMFEYEVEEFAPPAPEPVPEPVADPEAEDREPRATPAEMHAIAPGFVRPVEAAPVAGGPVEVGNGWDPEHMHARKGDPSHIEVSYTEGVGIAVYNVRKFETPVKNLLKGHDGLGFFWAGNEVGTWRLKGTKTPWRDISGKQVATAHAAFRELAGLGYCVRLDLPGHERLTHPAPATSTEAPPVAPVQEPEPVTVPDVVPAEWSAPSAAPAPAAERLAVAVLERPAPTNGREKRLQLWELAQTDANARAMFTGCRLGQSHLRDLAKNAHTLASSARYMNNAVASIDEDGTFNADAQSRASHHLNAILDKTEVVKLRWTLSVPLLTIAGQEVSDAFRLSMDDVWTRFVTDVERWAMAASDPVTAENVEEILFAAFNLMRITERFARALENAVTAVKWPF